MRVSRDVQFDVCVYSGMYIYMRGRVYIHACAYARTCMGGCIETYIDAWFKALKTEGRPSSATVVSVC